MIACAGAAAWFFLVVGVIYLLIAPFQSTEPIDFKSTHKKSSGGYHLCLFLFFEFFFLWSSVKIAGMFHEFHENPYISILIVAIGFILDFWLCWFYYEKADCI